MSSLPDPDDFRLETFDQDVSTSVLEESITEFGRELDRTIAESYADGAVAVDVIWVADHRKPVPTIVTWYGEAEAPADAVDDPIDHVIRYDLESISPGEFLGVLEDAPYEWDDIVPEVEY